MANLLKRGNTWCVRFNVPKDRQADVGRAMGARSGVKLEVVRTLGTTDYKTAQGRRDTALAAIREDVDKRLATASLRPLSDWTADWPTRAKHWQAERQQGVALVVEHEEGRDWTTQSWTAWDHAIDHAKADAETVAALRGRAAGDAFTQIVMGDGLTVAEAARMWLAEDGKRVKVQTLNGHKAVLKLFEGYLATHEGLATLEGVDLVSVTRRTAGAFITHRHATRAAATVRRESSTFNGLWRWARRKGHAEINPWEDQTAGLQAGPSNGPRGNAEKRGYTNAELVKLLRAGTDKLAPGGGGYGPALWDIIRLGLLTGARANELVSLRVCDVIEEGTYLVRAPHCA